jgi:TonB family protein
MDLVVHPLIERLGWTLLHSLWQGALIVLVYALLRVLLRERSPEARYALSLGTFVLLALAPLVTFFLIGAADGVAIDASAGTVTLVGAELIVIGADAMSAAPADLTSALAPWLPAVVAAWCAGVLVSALRVVGAWRHLGALRRSALPLGGPELERLVERLRHELGIDRAVRIARSTLVDSPTVLGWLEPLVLVPASALAGLAPQQLAMILAHELAHIRRHDYLVNAVQTAVETLLFYHPAVHWVGAKLRHEREECCDAIAVRFGGDAIAYARALAELEELRGLNASLALAATGGELLERIERLLGRRPRQQRGTALASACAFATLTALVVGVATPEWAADVERGGATASMPAAQGPEVAALVAEAVPVASAALPSVVEPTAAAPAPAPRAGALPELAPLPEPTVPAQLMVEATPQPEPEADASGDGVLAAEAPMAAPTAPASGAGPQVSGGRMVVGIAPEFPYGARRRGVTGTVTARISIDASGRTTGVEIVQADPPGEFERSVLRATRNWRFTPYLEDGVPVARELLQQFDFAAPKSHCEPLTGSRLCRASDPRHGASGMGVEVIRLSSARKATVGPASSSTR